MSKKMIETQVLVIGGGFIGTAIARELSKYKVEVCLVEKEPAVGFGVTKGSQGGVHSALGLLTSRLVKWWDRSVDVGTYLRTPLHTKEKFNIAGRKMLFELAPMLDVDILKCGLITFAHSEAEMRAFEIMKEVAEGLGFNNLALLDRNQLRDLEPQVDYSKRIGGIYDPDESQILPMEWTIALAENAKQNGVHIFLNTEVREIEGKGDCFLVKTNDHSFKAEYVINVAGAFSDTIAAMVEKIDWSFFLMEHQYFVLDNRNYIKHNLFEIPVPGEPRLMLLTPEGKILAGVIMQEIKNKHDLATTREGLEHIAKIPLSFVPSISFRNDLIRSFRAYLHFNTRDMDDYLIYWPRDRFLNLIVCPPGLSSAPALAQEVVKMLREKGLDLPEKNDFNPYRHRDPRFINLSNEEKNMRIQSNPRYGHIICRCEKASEQEVREAVRRGVTTLDEMKWHVRTGMGRCQGGFCTPHVLRIMAEEMGIRPLDIKQKGGDSYILRQKTKEALLGGGR